MGGEQDGVRVIPLERGGGRVTCFWETDGGAILGEMLHGLLAGGNCANIAEREVGVES